MSKKKTVEMIAFHDSGVSCVMTFEQIGPAVTATYSFRSEEGMPFSQMDRHISELSTWVGSVVKGQPESLPSGWSI